MRTREKIYRKGLPERAGPGPSLLTCQLADVEWLNSTHFSSQVRVARPPFLKSISAYLLRLRLCGRGVAGAKEVAVAAAAGRAVRSAMPAAESAGAGCATSGGAPCRSANATMNRSTATPS